MREATDGGSFLKTLGLVLGIVLLIGILAAPSLAPGTAGGRRLLAAGLVVVAGLPALTGLLNRRGAGGVTAAAGAALALTVLAAPGLASMPPAARRAAAVTALVATWWISVCIPIPATSLVPLVLLPGLGVMGSGETATVYANSDIFLFMGGFIIALGIQRWGLHRRIALAIIHLVGTNPRRMVLGFMLAAAFLSLWISNTATTLMMLPIGLAVIEALRETGSGVLAEPRRAAAFGAALMLGLAYGASIGGIGTPIGTPPNISFARILGLLYPRPVEVRAPAPGTFHRGTAPEGWPEVSPGDVLGTIRDRGASVPVRADTGGLAIQAPVPDGARVEDGQRLVLLRPKEGPPAYEITFGRWILAFLPLVLLFLPVTWLVLVRITARIPGGATAAGRDVIAAERRKLGRMSSAERRMLAVFVATALLWVFRKDMRIGSFVLPGWSGLLGRVVGPVFRPELLHDASVAMTMAVLLFILPSGTTDERGRRAPLMNWETARKLPWGILLLFGGGFAIARSFQVTGLSAWIGESFQGMGIRSPILLVLGTCLLLTFLTEVTSNTATTQVMLPVMAGAAAAIGAHPLLLMLPATISASCAFMLPIATPPNAIIFGSGQVKMSQMVRTGIILNLTGVVLVTAVFLLLAQNILGLDLGRIPEWALPALTTW